MEERGNFKICINNKCDKEFLENLNNKRLEIISNIVIRLIKENKL